LRKLLERQPYRKVLFNSNTMERVSETLIHVQEGYSQKTIAKRRKARKAQKLSRRRNR